MQHGLSELRHLQAGAHFCLEVMLGGLDGREPGLHGLGLSQRHDDDAIAIAHDNIAGNDGDATDHQGKACPALGRLPAGELGVRPAQ